MAYRIEISSKAEREIGKLPKTTREKIYAKLAQLGQPRPDGVVKLKGKLKDFYRVRVGDHRILYEIRDEKLLVIVVAVRDRREAYRV